MIKNKAFWVLIFAVMCSALAGYVNTEATKYVATFAQISLRFGSLAIIMAFWLSLRKNKSISLLRINLKDWIVAGGRGVVNILAIYLFIESLKLTTYGNVYLIQAVPFVSLYGWIILKERITSLKIAAVVLSFLGVAMLSVQNINGLRFGTGELYSLISGLLFSVFFVSRKYVSKKLNDEQVMWTTFVGSALTSLVLIWVSGENKEVIYRSLDKIGVIWLVLNTLISLIVNWGITVGFDRLEAVVAGVIYSLETPIAVLFGLLFLGESIDTKGAVGMVLVLLSIIILNDYDRLLVKKSV